MVDMVPKQAIGGGLGNKAPNAAQKKVINFFALSKQCISVVYPVREPSKIEAVAAEE